MTCGWTDSRCRSDSGRGRRDCERDEQTMSWPRPRSLLLMIITLLNGERGKWRDKNLQISQNLTVKSFTVMLIQKLENPLSCWMCTCTSAPICTSVYYLQNVKVLLIRVLFSVLSLCLILYRVHSCCNDPVSIQRSLKFHMNPVYRE